MFEHIHSRDKQTVYICVLVSALNGYMTEQIASSLWDSEFCRVEAIQINTLLKCLV